MRPTPHVDHVYPESVRLIALVAGDRANPDLDQTRRQSFFEDASELAGV